MIAPSRHNPCIGLDEVLPHRLGGFSRKGGNGDGRNGSIHIQLEHPSIYRKDHDKRQHCDQKASQQRHDPQGDGFQHPYRFDLFHDLCRKLCHTPVCHSRLCHDGRYDPLYNGKQGGHQFHAIHDGALCQCKPDKGFEGMFRLFHVCKAATGLYDPGCKKQYQKSISNGSQRPVDPGDDTPDRPALKDSGLWVRSVQISASFSFQVFSAEFRFCTIQLSLKQSHLLCRGRKMSSLPASVSTHYPTIRSRISFAKVMMTPPARVKNPLALWLGS